MAKVRDEQDLNKAEDASVHDHAEQLEKRINRVIRLINEDHEIDLMHKIFKKDCLICKIAKELK